MVRISRQMPYTPTLNEIACFEPTIPHITEVASNLTQWLRDENIFWIFTCLYWFYQGQGLYDLALPWSQQCVTATRERLEAEHPDVAFPSII